MAHIVFRENGSGFCRVARSRPCRICGKPDWCSTTFDGSISFCARSVSHADRISICGWGVYYNPESYSSLHKSEDFVRNPHVKRVVRDHPSSPADHRDAIYRTIIKLSSIHRDSRAGWLLKRGLRDLDRYGVLPKTLKQRTSLAKRVVAETDFEEDSNLFRYVPGFWRSKNGRIRLGCDGDYPQDQLLIPYLNSDGLIVACQVRPLQHSDRTHHRYSWLSSVRMNEGSRSGTPLHHEGSLRDWGNKVPTVFVVEGALKAAVSQHFLPDKYVVANGGVSTSHKEIVKTARDKPMEIAFDTDSFYNPHVARSVASLIALRLQEQRFLRCRQPTNLLTWARRFKGIDDALLAGVSTKKLDIGEWLEQLTPECFEAAQRQLAGIVRRK